jgi:hypothetical protein
MYAPTKGKICSMSEPICLCHTPMPCLYCAPCISNCHGHMGLVALPENVLVTCHKGLVASVTQFLHPKIGNFSSWLKKKPKKKNAIFRPPGDPGAAHNLSPPTNTTLDTVISPSAFYSTRPVTPPQNLTASNPISTPISNKTSGNHKHASETHNRDS